MDFQNVADNLRESFRAIAASRMPGEIRELPGVSIASAGVVFQMFNAAFLSTPVANETELARRIMLPSVHFDARSLEWAYWVCGDWLEARAHRRSRQIFQRHGLRHTANLPGMVAERILPPVKPLPHLEIRRVRDAGTREAFCAIGSVCFHVPLPWFREVFDNDTVWDRFIGWVGYLDGEPVSTAATVIGGGAVGVYNVATMPEHQKRGYGETVMRHAVAEAQRRYGIEQTVLQSTPAGHRLYERMGFRTVTQISVYAS